MRPRSSNDRDGRGRRARLLTALGSGVAALGVTTTLVAVTARPAASQDTRTTLASAVPAAVQVITEADTFPALPTIKTPADEPKVLEEVYTFVAANPEVAKYMPCFCACGRNKIHKSIEDCFIKSRGATRSQLVWSTHGGECMICIAVAAEARKLFLQGESVNAIRDEIERTLGPKFKFHTDTPLPPTQ